MTSILIIDDDERLATPLKEYFARFNLALHSEVHPVAGMSRLESGEYDLVILDVMLPGQDGFEVCRTIRKTSAVPIVMLTARGEVTDRIVGLEIGADDYMPKPFEPRELVARIQNVLRRSADSKSPGKQLAYAGLTVDLEDAESGETVSYTLLGEEEADVSQGRISVSSPVARALLGKSVGDFVTVRVPRGTREFEVLEIRNG